MRWEVLVADAVEVWLDGLIRNDLRTFELVAAAIDKLEDEGPGLGWPLVDTVRGSRHPNMKELRPGSTRSSELRILFAFDLERHALLLVAGDKAGNWQGWYRENIPIADERFAQHQAELKKRPEDR